MVMIMIMWLVSYMLDHIIVHRISLVLHCCCHLDAKREKKVRSGSYTLVWHLARIRHRFGQYAHLT